MEYGGVFTTTSTTPIFDSIPSAEHIHTVEMMDHPQAGLDFMEELLSEGCWLEATGGMINSQNNNVHSLLSSDHYPNYTAHHLNYILNPHHQIYQEDHHHNQGLIFQEIQSSDQNFVVEQTGVCRRWWISPRAYPTPCSSVKERLILAIGCLKECTKDIHDDHVRDVHIQIWVPVKSKAGAGSGSGSRRAINSNSSNSSNSSGSDYQFGAQDWQDYFLGLHGRAGHVLTKLPDWTTAEVRFWRRDEYYNNSTRHHHVRGGNSCLAVPVFERDSGVCLGVVEIFMATITTTARTSNNYRPDLEYISEALESVDLRSFQNCSPPSVKPCTADELYQAALSEIIEVLTSVCKTHRLPLAITWAPCAQQGKAICRNSDDHQNYLCCISTIESAYYIADLEILSFLEACNEHHLLPGQGIVGTAFSTNKPCFAVDITAFSKNEYPLSHHARVFGLQTAVAIPLRSVYTGLADFMLEFFLPKDCVENEEQKRMLNSLSIAIQQSCRSLHFVLEKDQLEEEALMPPNGPPSKEETQKLSSSANPLDESGLKESSWIAHMMEAQQKGKGISVSLEYQTEPREEFKVTTHWDNIQGGSLLPPNGQVFSAFNGQLQQSSGPKVSVEGGGESDSFAGRRPSGGRKPGEKRRTKAEKTISLPVLRQYFAGSLKDAAKSIGVCPTTLKRICRQHGINRWPSRKIKKVGHSLRKLQLVIDSVHGTEGAIQIGSFYKSFPELSSPNFGGTEGFPSLTMHDHHQGQQLHHQAESGLFSHGAPSKSPTSSCSQTSGPAGVKQHTTTTTPITALGRGDVLIMAEDPVGVLHRVCSEAEFHALNQDDPNNLRSQSPPYGPGGGDALRVKATLGEEKIRFSLQPNWHFRDLQLEIARRFNVDDISRILVRYVDDDGELVLLTCDTDLEECKQIYLSSSQSHTIRLSLQWASHQNLGSSFRSSSPS